MYHHASWSEIVLDHEFYFVLLIIRILLHFLKTKYKKTKTTLKINSSWIYAFFLKANSPSWQLESRCYLSIPNTHNKMCEIFCWNVLFNFLSWVLAYRMLRKQVWSCPADLRPMASVTHRRVGEFVFHQSLLSLHTLLSRRIFCLCLSLEGSVCSWDSCSLHVCCSCLSVLQTCRTYGLTAIVFSHSWKCSGCFCYCLLL